MIQEERSPDTALAAADVQDTLYAAGEIAHALDELASVLEVWEVDPAEYAAAIASGGVTYVKPWPSLTEAEEALTTEDDPDLTITPYPAHTHAVAIELSLWLAQVAAHTVR